MVKQLGKEINYSKEIVLQKMSESGNSKSKELYLAKKNEPSRAIAAARKMESKNIADQLKQNKSEALKCLFRMAR